MRILAATAALLLLLPACLDSPPSRVGSGDGGGGDSDGPGDGATGCPGSLALALRTTEDLAGWMTPDGPSCGHATTGEGLEFTNLGEPSTCRAYADDLVDLTAGWLRVRLNDSAPSLSMTFSLILGPAHLAPSARRWLYFDRDDGVLQFGECSPELGCFDTFWGSVDYGAGTHVWLRFSHMPGDDILLIETSPDGSAFEVQAAPDGVGAAEVGCVGIDLGSYEEETSAMVRRSSFSDLATE